MRVVAGLASSFAFHGVDHPFCSAVRVPSIHATSSHLQGKHGRLGRLDKTGWVSGGSARDAGAMLGDWPRSSPVPGCHPRAKAWAAEVA